MVGAAGDTGVALTGRSGVGAMPASPAAPQPGFPVSDGHPPGRKRGAFIVLEGLDGSGKTTAARRLAASLRAEGRQVIETREPGGSRIGEAIRDILLAADATMRPETEALLFAASRAQHVHELILPALERGSDVVCDRFVDSSLAYQWGGRGLAFADVLGIQSLATGGLQPDLKLLLDLPAEAALQRRGGSGQTNRLDREELMFYQRIRAAYLELAAADPQRWRIIDASRTEDEVWSDVRGVVVTVEGDRQALNQPQLGSRPR